MKANLNQPVYISITAGTIFKGIIILLLFYFLFIVRDLLLIILTSIVLASAIEPGARFFMKHKIPRLASVLLVYVISLILLVGIFYIFLPPLIQDFSSMTRTLPEYIESFDATGRLGSIPGLSELLSSDGFSASEVFSKVTQTVTGATVGVLNTASSIFGGLLSLILIIVISFYLAVQDDGVADFLKIVVPRQHEKYIVGLWKRSQAKIGKWMQGQLVLALIVGLFTYLGLSIIGVSNPMFLAVLAAIFELIPIFGPILAAIPAIGFAAIDGGFTLVLFTLALYAIIQQFESQLIHPLVVKKIVGIPALVAIIALIIGAQVAGFLGIILSVPIAAIVMEIISDIEKKKHAEDRELAK